MGYSVNGRCHRALQFLADGPKPIIDLRELIAVNGSPCAYRRTWPFVSAMIRSGEITYADEMATITDQGQWALQDLNEGFSWEAPRPTVRVFVARAAA